MIQARIDVHAHILPGIDDGCGSIAESLSCARLLVAAGYSHVFCTPHIAPQLPDNNVPFIALATADLQKHIEGAKIPLHLLPGGEVSLQRCLLDAPPEELVTYALHGKYMLADIWCNELPAYFRPLVRRLRSLGIKVILAHPERMEAVKRNPRLVDDFLEMDLLLQGNLECFGLPLDSRTRQLAEQFLLNDRYFMLGTDCHTVDTLPPRLDGLGRAIELAGQEAVNELTVENPRVLLPPSVFD